MADLNYKELAKIYVLVDSLLHKLREAQVTQQLTMTLPGYVMLLSRLNN